MKIAIPVCVYPPYKGGIGTAAVRHARALADLGHDVHVICPVQAGRAGPVEVVDGVQVHRLRPTLRHGLSAFLPELAWLVRGYDAMLLEYPFFGAAEPAAIGARLGKVPYLAYFHMDVMWSGVRGAVLAVHRRTVAPLVLRGAREVLVSSCDYAAHSSIARLGLSTIRELPYSVDTDAFTPQDIGPERRRQLGIDAQRPIVLFVGTMGEAGAFKGIDRLLAAMATRDLASRAQVVLAGEGELRPEYMRQAARLLPDGAYHFTGGVPDEDLRDLYRAASVTVLPSVTSEEAFGIVLIESMACGTPVIASALPGVRGVVSPDVGIAVPPGDVPRLAAAIDEIVTGGALADRRGAARDRAVVRFSRDRERADLGEAVDRLRS